MGEVIQIGGETVLDFIEREGPVTTSSVAGRFGQDHGATYALLRRLERQGVVASRLDSVSYIGSGSRARVWFRPRDC